MFPKITRNRVLVCVALLIVVVVAAVLYMRWLMSQPLYCLGDVSAGENLTASLNPPAQTKEDQWLVEKNINLHFDKYATVEKYGTGEPVLVVHGGPGIPYNDCWKGLKPLTNQFEFYFYHQRGCGLSTRPFERFDDDFYSNMVKLEKTLGLGAQIADIERIRQILGKEKLILVGHSYGGFIATLYAAEFPDRVEKLVLVAPAGLLTPPDENRDIFALTRKKLDKQKRVEFDKNVQQYLDFGNLFSKSEKDLQEIHLKLGSYILSAMGYSQPANTTTVPCGGWAVFAMYFSTGTDYDYKQALEQITAPTLIVVGKDDDISMAGAKSYRPISRSVFKVIDRDESASIAGHFIFDDCPDGFANVIATFLENED